jgi:hypothetical protein
MPVTVTRYSDLTQAFRLSADDIRKLSDILSVFGDSFTCTIYCTDGLAREYPTIKDVLEYENPPTKQIRALEITVRSADYSGFIQLNFRNRRRDSITVHLDGPEDVISKINNNLDDFFPRVRTWYGFIATMDFADVLFKFFIVFMAAVFIVGAAGLLPTKESDATDTRPTAEKLRSLLLLASFPGALFVLGYIFKRVREWLFPAAEFAIGQGFNRDAHRERLRGGVVAVIVIPSLLSALGYVIWKIMG